MGLLEVVSTIVFLRSQNPELTDDYLFAGLKWLKPHLTDGERTIGINRALATSFGLLFLL